MPSTHQVGQSKVANMTPVRPILVAGSINIDLVTYAERIPLPGETVAGTGFATHSGGKGANQAVAIARLGHPVRLIGRIGSDYFGEQLLNSLQQDGVDTEGVQKVPGTSGVAVVTVSPEGQNSIVVMSGANSTLRPEDLEAHLDKIRNAAVVLTQLEVPLETVQRLAEICHRERVPLILDPAPARELPADLLRLVTWFTPNETEAAFYLKAAPNTPSNTPAEVAKALQSLGPKNILLKQGSRGFHIRTVEGLAESHHAIPVHAVDTTAAGDCFNGAFATALATGRSPVEAARFASAAAAISVTRHGAQPSMPTLEEVNQLLTN